MAAIIKDLEQVNVDLIEQKEKVENVDFKMVTFSLAGKEYGVDIMSVKEIAKADKFTFVPNAASFIRGVYNLRGDIIPIIDLRNFFHLPTERKTEGQENMLILHINDQVYGTIVDRIDKVVGVNKESIQPPHPIFGDINIKYISGVVEKEGTLFIILDVVRIFTVNEEEKGKSRSTAADSGEYFVPSPLEIKDLQKPGTDSAISFLQESLLVLKNFQFSSINEAWIHRRFNEWSKGREDEDLQLKTVSEADDFLDGFVSPYTGEFLSDSYAASVTKVLPDIGSQNINVWNIGCGKGYETYSFACILKARYPGARIKIWANDNDIMAVSQAPNITFELDDLPNYCRPFVVRGKSGYSFNTAIKDSIVFEYHDILHETIVPDLDIVLVRDVLSYFKEDDQVRIVNKMSEKLKSRGMVFIGRNEELSGIEWQRISDDPISAYLHVV